MGLVLRSGAAPVMLGVRWVRRRTGSPHHGLPALRRGLAVSSKVALDEIFFASELVSASIVPREVRHRLASEVDEAVALFRARGWLDEPASYHLSPPPLEVASIQEERSAALPYRHLQYDSGYEPHPGEPGRDRWLNYEPNRTAHAWLLKHPGRMRPWLVCVPGYRMGHPMVDFMAFRVRWLHQTLGVNVAVPLLPLHGPRRTGRRGGDGFLSGDFIDTLHAQTQAVWDIRRLVGWLRELGAPAIGVHGVSLGGYTAALLASLDPHLDCAIAGIPAADFLRLLRAHAPEFLLKVVTLAGFPLDDAELMLRVVSPLALEPRVPQERRYLYAGLADHLAPPDHARDLWLHWGSPRVAWYHGGHASFAWEKDVGVFVADALRESGMLPRPFLNASN
jgi:hypothetical protein